MPEVSAPKWFDNLQPTMCAVVDHGVRTNFAFTEERVPWRWQEMVAQLRDEGIRQVVGGAKGTAALTGCSLEIRAGSYDHARHHANVKEKPGERQRVKFPVWDFVLHRNDGSAVRLHPAWSNRKVPAWEAIPHKGEVQPPPKGLGKSKGRGTFRFYAEMDRLIVHWFDFSKEP